MTCLTNPISQPNLDISPIQIPIISNKVTNLQGGSVCSHKFFMGFYKVSVLRFSFYSTNSTGGRHTIVSQRSSIFDMHGCGVLVC
jgi:hypothetical protein